MAYKVEIIPSNKDSIYEERETGITHSPFELEYILYKAIEAGNPSAVASAIDAYLNLGITMGRMSNNAIRQTRYWAVACISTAIHYAILGGLDETDAYNLSDAYIMHLDTVDSIEEVIDYLKEKASELTEAVHLAKFKSSYSTNITRAIHYIHVHLHERLKIEDIASNIGLSRDYLSYLFKKEVGISIHQYILDRKLAEANRLISLGKPINQVSYTLSFSSESHFITCYKKKYGVTPGK